MIEYEINQELVPARLRVKEVWLKRLLRAIERHLRLRGIHTLSIAFVDAKTIRRLNRTYRGEDKTTDILSFPEVGGDRALGELLLAWPYVKKQAKKQGKVLKEELALLFIHGVLHLYGHAHKTKKDAKKMFDLQDKILKDL